MHQHNYGYPARNMLTMGYQHADYEYQQQAGYQGGGVKSSSYVKSSSGQPFARQIDSEVCRLRGTTEKC